jgi:nucleoside-diphosphate-sugar epimerase
MARHRILLTGASGYVASYLAPALRSDAEIVGLDRLPPRSPSFDRFIVGDLCDDSVVKAAGADVDTVIHLAAAKADWGVSEAEFFRDNVDATASLVAGLRGSVQKWLLFSSVAVYGPSSSPASGHSAKTPTTAYGRSKLECERVLEELVDSSDARVVVLRPSVIFGPRHPPSTNIHRLIEGLRRRTFIPVGSGTTLKSTSYIENVVSASVHLLNTDVQDAGSGFSVFNYVDEPVPTTDWLVERICRLVGRGTPKLRLPLGAVSRVAGVNDRLSDMLHIDLPITRARITKFNTSTNYDAARIRQAGYSQLVPLDEALVRTVDWHLAQRTRKSHRLGT